jgi:hypothetical protein
MMSCATPSGFKLLQTSLREWGADIGDRIPPRQTVTNQAHAPLKQAPPEQSPEESQPTAIPEAIFTTHLHRHHATQLQIEYSQHHE